MASIIRIRHIKVGTVVDINCVGIRMVGECVRRDIGARTIRWTDGSEGRITDGFIDECDRIATYYDPAIAAMVIAEAIGDADEYDPYTDEIADAMAGHH
jgi:hypothetical protein